MTVRIAIDCMGGDHGVPVTVPAALRFAQSEPNAVLTLVGRESDIKPHLARAGEEKSRLIVLHSDDVVGMDEPPAQALRSKRDSSMGTSIALVKKGQVDACVSSGNTGALMAIARFMLKTLDGIDRPAIATAFPNQRGGETTVLDLGANVDCTAEQLFQFAVLGVSLVAALQEKERPTVGLLNIGEELIKGNDTVKRAGELLRASPLNFHGNVEGNDIYKGTTDVVVCDGFVGNIVMKASEGLAQLLASIVKEEFTRNALSKMLAVLAYPVLSSLKHRLDHRRYNGASLLGLRGIVIKSHGSADTVAFEYALRRAYEMAHHKLVDRTAAAMQPFLSQLTPSSRANEGNEPASEAA